MDELKAIKILLIGDSGVGKSCLLIRYADNMFNDSFVPTIGVDFKTKYINVDGQQVKLQLWDTAGQEKFRSLTKAYMHGAKGILVVFDISDRDTFIQSGYWIDMIRESDDSVDLILVGNKCDLDHVVSAEEIEIFTKKYDIHYFETSAKDNTNVEEAFNYLGTQTFRRISSKIEPISEKTINIDKNNQKKCTC